MSIERREDAMTVMPARALPLASALTLALALGACSESVNGGLDQGGADTREPPDLAPADDSLGGDSAVPDAGPLAEPGTPCDADGECTTGHCLATSAGRVCAWACSGTGCPLGQQCSLIAGDAICVDLAATFCMPCTDHADCARVPGADGNRCLGYGIEGRFCGVACGDGLAPCPDGSTCQDGQCRAATCACSGLAVEVQASTFCGVESPGGGLCTGTRRCEAVGGAPTRCDAAPPAAERCNGLDDDCDGQTDERPLTPSCGDFACAGSEGCRTRCEGDADCIPGLACDKDDKDGDGRRDECLATGVDGTLCQDDGECDNDYCANGHCCTRASGNAATVCCAEDSDCAAFDGEARCTGTGLGGCKGVKVVGRCEDSVCKKREVESPEGCAGQVCRGGQCNPGGVYAGPHLCDSEGACQSTGDAPCDDGDPCTFDSCSATRGCETAPRSGVTEGRCYTYPAETRGVGACMDGFAVCQNGQVSGCQGERGPLAELCNGRDDDCDGTTDEDTARECSPYTCGPAGRCLVACRGGSDCASGHYCEAGKCIPSGENGAPCGEDEQCASGHCGGGVCCAAGLCCQDHEDCAALDALSCDAANASGCSGTRVVGVCGPGAQCVGESRPDAGACLGTGCAAPSCEGVSRVAGATCGANGVCVEGARVRCTPYACLNGSCKTGCSGDGDCVEGARCKDGQCKELPDGAHCGASSQCKSGHCEGGFCCKGQGLCCGGADADCAALDGDSECVNPSLCAGFKSVGVCNQDFQCTQAFIAWPAACLGSTCAEPSCVNLAGLSLVLEGVKRNTCDEGGACVETTRDCRDNAAYSYCAKSAPYAATCQGCNPDRSTCVVFGNPCTCE
jgi:hypothetical protein